MALRELNDLEDDKVEIVPLKRFAKTQAAATETCFGTVGEISNQDFLNEVNKAGNDIWVVLHLYKQGTSLW